jgi:endonuclease/exonuclease/phosphatase family metal-dependent hydrolase
VFRPVHRFTVMMATAALLVALVPVGVSARSSAPVVMTRNLYLGADLSPAILAPNAPALFQAAADIYLNVVATDFPERAKLIAEEIEDHSPDLIGLQEVALWQTGTLLDPTAATTVEFDYLALLQAELASLGLDYTAAVVQETFDAEVPATVSSTGTPVLKDVRLTQRNVILVRDGVSHSNPQSVYFDTNAVYPNLGGVGLELVDLRGWTSIDVSMEPKDKTFRFLNTHLESFVSPVRDAQAQELVDGPLSTNLFVIAVGDFNSPPTGADSGAYGILTSPNNGKLRDAWTATHGTDPGYTFGQDPDLLNEEDFSSVRIDLVLTKTAALKATEATLTGTTAKTPTGLWASDHFGVVSQISLP